MASQEFLRWQSKVKSDGGRITVAPSGKPSAAYPPEVWVSMSNRRAWPLPNEYSDNGKTGYYHAPTQLVAEIEKFGIASKTESENAGRNLMEQWGIPKALQSLGNFSATVKSIALIALIVGGIAYVATHRRERD